MGNTGLSEKAAADFALTDLSGKTVRLSDFKGKIVLLDFWATWCAPCRKEIPDLIQLQRQYASRGFTVLGIALDEEGAAVVKPLAQKLIINYPVVIGNTQVAAAYGGIQAVPTTLLIGRDGGILKTYLGAREKSEFQSDIQSALQRTNAAAK
jgi:thiol-disulfide isomerase/thioredoxin